MPCGPPFWLLLWGSEIGPAVEHARRLGALLTAPPCGLCINIEGVRIEHHPVVLSCCLDGYKAIKDIVPYADHGAVKRMSPAATARGHNTQQVPVP